MKLDDLGVFDERMLPRRCVLKGSEWWRALRVGESVERRRERPGGQDDWRKRARRAERWEGGGRR
jgi:hypothetical protein